MRARTRAGLALTGALAALPLALAAPASAASFTNPAAPCGPVPPPASDFTDRAAIPAVHVVSVDCAAAAQIVQGRQDGTYGPAETVSRGQMAAFVVRALRAGGYDLPAPSAGQDYDDVPVGSTFHDDISVAKQIGIVQGVTATTYAPDVPTVRDQMARFLVGSANYAYAVGGTRDDLVGGLAPAATTGYSDVPPTDMYAGDIRAASELLGVAEGRADGTYGPKEQVRRDQMATFVVRLLDMTQLPR